MGVIKENTNDVGENEEKGTPHTFVGGNIICCSHYGKQYGYASKSKNRNTT